MECLEKNTTKVKNITKYLLAILYNAPDTMDGDYKAEVNKDCFGSNTPSSIALFEDGKNSISSMKVSLIILL